MTTLVTVCQGNTGGITRGFGPEVPGGIPGAGPGADSVSACCREARLAQADATYGARFPKAAAKVAGDLDQLLSFYDYPAEYWVHLRTTSPIESTFATVRHRTKITRGSGHSPDIPQVVVATGSRLVFVAGQEPEDEHGNLVGPGDLAVQARQVFANLAGARWSRRPACPGN